MQLLAVLLATTVAVSAVGTAKHKVNFQSTPINFNDAQKLLFQEGFQMVNSDKQYLCYLPPVETTLTTAKDYISTPNHVLLDQAVSTLEKSFRLNECVFKFAVNGEYWTYGYCFGDKVIQFHHNLDYYRKTKHFKPEYPANIYKLGMFDAKSRPKPLEIANQLPWDAQQTNLKVNDFEIIDDFVNPFSRSIVPAKNSDSEQGLQKLIKHVLKNGDICDLTDFSRTIDIIYKCDPGRSVQAQILDVHEIKSCEYQMIVHVPQLCEIDEFRPIEAAEEIVEITCRKVTGSGINHEEYGQENSQEFNKELNFLTFLDHPKRYPLPEEHVFAVDHDYKISLADYNLLPFGDGFFSAISRDPVGSNNLYFDHRHVLVYNGVLEPNSVQVLESFGRVLLNAVERKLLAPVDHNDVHPSQLFIRWEDSFILWFEMYNSIGQFVNMVRVERDGKNQEPGLTLNFIDPVTMLDEEGRQWTIREYQGDISGVNYEKFERGSKKGESRKERRRRAKKETETKHEETKTVTETLVLYATDGSFSNDPELFEEELIQKVLQMRSNEEKDKDVESREEAKEYFVQEDLIDEVGQEEIKDDTVEMKPEEKTEDMVEVLEEKKEHSVDEGKQEEKKVLMDEVKQEVEKDRLKHDEL